jgi:hypothetical protein
MKTTKIYTVLSLVLVFAAVTSSFGSAIGKITAEGVVNRGIHHVVNVNLTIDKPLCNTYLVEIRDAQGQLVAPSQRYVPGVSKYEFFERGPASGVRIASLVRANYGNHFICEYELFTSPAFVAGPFLIGQTYRFDLFPSLQPNKE